MRCSWAGVFCIWDDAFGTIYLELWMFFFGICISGFGICIGVFVDGVFGCWDDVFGILDGVFEN